MIIFSFSIIFILLFSSCLYSQNDWQKCDCDNEIYFQISNSKKDYQTKCTFEVNIPIEKCVEILCNAENHTKWIYQCSKGKNIETKSKSGIYCDIIKAPFFMKDREIFVKYTITHKSNDCIEVTNECIPKYRPINDKYERITRYKTIFVLTAKNKIKTEISYFSEIGGPEDLPKFLQNIFLCKSADETIKNLNEINQ